MTVKSLIRRLRARARSIRWRLRPDHSPVARCVATGPPWFLALVADSFDIVGDAEADSDESVPRFRWQGADTDSSVSRPFISPRRSYPGSLRRLPTGVPTAFRELDASARSRPDDGYDESGWLHEAHRRHLAARAARSTTLERLVGEGSIGGHAPSSIEGDSVNVVCVSFRLELLPALIEQFDRQVHQRRTLTIMRTSVPDASTGERLRQACAGRNDIVVLDRPGVPLGACLNEALTSGTTALMAKWDDDDLYGPHFLSDLVLEHRATDAAIVGKHSYCTYLTSTDRMYVRFPGRSHRDVMFVAGGTLLIDRNRTASVRFPDVDLGEDRGFLERSAAAGLRIRSSDPFNYVQIRNTENTWQIADTDFIDRSILVADGLDLDAAFV